MKLYKRTEYKEGWECISSLKVKYEAPVYTISAANIPLETLAQSNDIKSDSMPSRFVWKRTKIYCLMTVFTIREHADFIA
jgi:hypothetical protein